MSGVIENIENLLPDVWSIDALWKSIAAEHPEETPSAPESSGEITAYPVPPSDIKPKAAGRILVPAKPAVYILIVPDGSPILAATTANLRRALQGRLSAASAATNRINYSEISASVRYRIVGGAFAASWWYYRAVRSLFPDRYKTMLAWKGSWFVSVNLEEEFPRFQISKIMASPPAINAGPLPTRRQAKAVQDTLEDIFDLCRYYEILRHAPHGQACAYKELGKCPAPCDGSISMAAYRTQMAAATSFLADIDGARYQWFNEQSRLMRAAASTMDFRGAGSMKRKLDQVENFEETHLSAISNMDKWKYLILQRGKTRHWIAPFIAGPGWIAALPEVAASAAANSVESWMGYCDNSRPMEAEIRDAPRFAVEEIAALVAYHKYRVNDAGLYIPMDGNITALIIGRALNVWLHAGGMQDIMEVNSEQNADITANVDAAPQ